MEIQSIVDNLARVIKRPITLEDINGRLIAYSVHDNPVDAIRLETLLRKGATQNTICALRKHGVYQAINSTRGIVRVPAIPEIGFKSRIAVAIRSGKTVLGYLWVADDGKPVLPHIEAQIIRTSQLLAEKLVPIKSASKKQEKAALVAALTSEAATSPDSIKFKADSLGWNLESPYQVLVVESREDIVSSKDVEAMGAEIETVTKKKKKPPLVAIVQNRIVLVYAGVTAGEVKRVAASLDHEMSKRGFSVMVGLGGSYSTVSEIKKSYDEALNALSLGTKFRFKEPYFEYNALALYNLICCMVRCKSFKAYGRDIVEEIAVYDRIHGSNLLKTLEVILDFSGKRKEAAQCLNVHPNTLDYRLRKIKQIAKVEIDDPNIRLALHLWVKALKYSKEDTQESERNLNELYT